MGRPNESEALERRRNERAADGDRFVDLCIDFELAGKLIATIGGRWDRREKAFLVGDGAAPQTSVRIAIHPGQLMAVQWFTGWLRAHVSRRANPPADFDPTDETIDTTPDHVYSALFAGGRRGGKTWIAVAMAVAYAVAFPGAIVWIVSPSNKKHDEARRYASGCIAPSWLKSETAGGWEFINGSAVMLKSGFLAESVKEGEVNFAVINEGQRLKERVFTILRGSVVDKSGCVLVCANPPVEESDQPWVSDFAASASAGKRAAVYLEFDPLANPHINRRALLAMRAELDDRSYKIEVLGFFLGPKTAVAYNWLRLYNERPVADPRVHPDLVDVTEIFLRLIEEGEGITDVIGIDFQRVPYMGGPVYRFFVPSGITPTRDNVYAWAVDEIRLEGDEEEWCRALAARRDATGQPRFSPATTLIIGDASGQYQHSRRRTTDSPPPSWTGRGSFSLIRGMGWTRIKPPDPRMDCNPELVDRARAFTSLISTADGHRRLFVDPDRAPYAAKTCREWKNVHGKPSRSQEVAHMGDGLTYPLVRLFPRVLHSGKPGPGGDPIPARTDKPESRSAPTRVDAPQLPRRGRRMDGL